MPWRRDRLPTPVFLGFPSDSAGKESTCNVGDLGLIPEWEDTMERGKCQNTRGIEQSLQKGLPLVVVLMYP